jgi:hypothetical protein
MPEKPEIDVQRRRKGDKPTRQAQKPTRRDTGSPSRPVTTGGGSTGGFSLPTVVRSGKGKLGCGGIILTALVIILYVIFGGGSGDLPTGDQESVYEDQPQTPLASSTPRPTPVDTGDETWLVMTYQDADDQVLEQDIFIDLNEMERIGSTNQVRIVSQIDRFSGGFSADGNWSSARRYLVLYDNDLNSIGSELLGELGEVNMADKDTLIDFVTWAIQSYPSDHYVLLMSDHGMGWPGGWSDPDPGGRDPSRAPLIQQLKGDSIYLSELDEALAQIVKNTGIDKFDLIGLDACLMSQLEVYSALQPYARYAVASEETEPGLGWAYSAFLSLLVYDPTTDPADLAANIVETYIDQDERVVDDQARMEFLRQNSSTGGFFRFSSVSASQLASQLEQGVTLAAVDLETLPTLNERLNELLFAMQSIDQGIIAGARSYTQSYTSIFGRNVPPSYIDLGHFVELLAQKTNDRAVRQAASDVLDALNDAVIAEKHGKSKPGSTGIAIYFPNSALYKSSTTGIQSYAMLANRFVEVSLWDDFLGFHYANRSFSQDADIPVVPPSNSITRSPGTSQITISDLVASSNSVNLDESIRISADIIGKNVGYVYFFTGLLDETSNSILVADIDFLESDQTQSLNGVYYPVWPESGSFRMNFDWEPTLFEITDGDQYALALFNPITYGATSEEAIYAVEGIFTFGESGETRKAEMYFKDGKLFQIFGYLEDETAGAPYEISATAGDTFTILRKWLELDASGNISEIVYDYGDTLIFNDTAFDWEQVYTPYGTYLVGFLVSDLDGNLTQAYIEISVD